MGAWWMHVYSSWTCDYYFKRFGRKGLDNADIPMDNFVHPGPSGPDIFTATVCSTGSNAGCFGDGVNGLR